jgi:UDP-N-acetylmuramoylalanine-D-glutamate ligase
VAAVPRISELEFAWRELHAPVIAITGTNGKSTTTALAAHLLVAAGFDAVAAGNIGVALSDVALREGSPTGWWWRRARSSWRTSTRSRRRSAC